MEESRRLYRSETDKMIAGVCGGIGEFFGIDPTLVRVGFLVLALAGGAGVPLYIAMWVIVPRASRVGAPGSDVARDAADEVRETVQRSAEQARGAYERWRGDRDAAGTPSSSSESSVSPAPGGATEGGAPTTPPPAAPGAPGAPTTPSTPSDQPDTSAGVDSPDDTGATDERR